MQIGRISALIAALCLASRVVAATGYIADDKGCKIANPDPKPGETVTWSGACKDGYAEGEGDMQWYLEGKPAGHYVGSLAHGALSGNGKLTLPDGTSYEGGWLNGKQEGKGTLKAADGGTYQGEWKNGEPHGRGVMRSGSGESVSGMWKEGIYIGPAKD
jgi:hypothetical protein